MEQYDNLTEEGKREYVIQHQQDIKVKSYQDIPYGIFNMFIEDKNTSKDFQEELNNIKKNYNIYEKGAIFETEGTSGDYIPSTVRFKTIRSLIKKEARFLFSESPDIKIVNSTKSNKITQEEKKDLSLYNEFLQSVLKKNAFESNLLKAAKDCFIGKRIAIIVNFNEQSGITIDFLSSLNFYYEVDKEDREISKFVAVIPECSGLMMKENKYFVKEYTRENGKVFLRELSINGMMEEEEITKKQEVEIDVIPVRIVINEGLVNDLYGESEVEELVEFESAFSKVCNADIDALRKGMNPIRFTVDMDSNSTKNLPSGPGSQWDLIGDQGLPSPKPQVGMLENQLAYSEPMKTTLDRIKTNAYELIDVPNVNMETMSGTITTGKGLKAVYWPLTVRCNEKMKIWGPALIEMVIIIIEGSKKYKKLISRYIKENLEEIDYTVEVVNNLPLPEDEQEEKTIDLQEVESKVMSRKAYMQKWRGLTDVEVQEELKQIAAERVMLEDSVFEQQSQVENEETEDNFTDESEEENEGVEND